jgi:hypothetical protein
MPYPTASEIADLSTNGAFLALDEDRQQLLVDSAISAIEEYTGQSFGDPFVGAIEVESVRGDALWLPRRIEVLESIAETGSDPMELDAIAITHDGARLKWRRNVVGLGYYEQALYEVSGHDYPTRFPEGFVTVTGIWGYSELPNSVLRAILYDVEDSVAADVNALTPSIEYARSMGLKSMSQGNLSFELFGERPHFSGRVAAVLDPLVFAGVGGSSGPGRLV